MLLNNVDAAVVSQLSELVKCSDLVWKFVASFTVVCCQQFAVTAPSNVLGEEQCTAFSHTMRFTMAHSTEIFVPHLVICHVGVQSSRTTRRPSASSFNVLNQTGQRSTPK